MSHLVSEARRQKASFVGFLGCLVLAYMVQPAFGFQSDPADKLIQQLSSPDAKTRMEAVEKLGRVRPVPLAVIAALTKAIDNKDDEVACLATSALGEIGKPAKSVVPKLIGIAKSNSNKPILRAHALIALGRIGEEPDTVVPVILAALKSDDGTVLWGAMFGATGFKAQGQVFVKPLVDIVRRPADTQAKAEAAGLACEALSQLAVDGTSASAIPALIDDLVAEIEAYHQRQAAARGKPVDSSTDWRRFKTGKVGIALGRIHELAKEKDPAVPAVLVAVQKEMWMGTSFSTALQTPNEFVQTLLPMLKHDNAIIRRGAAWALASQPKAMQANLMQLIELLEDQDGLVRIAAAESVLKIDPARASATDLIVRMLQEKKDELRWAALKSIRDLSQSPQAGAALAPSAVPKLVAMVEIAGRAEKAEVLQALWSIGEPAADAAEVVVRVAMNSSVADRRTVIPVLNRLGPKVIPPLITGLRDVNPRTRERAAQVLAAVIAGEIPYLGGDFSEIRKYKKEKATELRLPDDAGIAALIAATKDSDARVRWRTAIALGEVGPRAVAAVPSLVDLLNDKTSFVRWDAAWAIGEIDPTAAADERRRATADQPTAINKKGDRLTLLRFDPPLPIKLAAGEQINVRIAYELKSADQRYVAISAWHGDNPARYANGGLITCHRGTGEATNVIYGPGPIDRIRFLLGDQHLNPAKIELELPIATKVEWADP